MADKVSYEISLEIEGADKVNSQVDRIDRALQDVSKNAKSLNFEAANQTLADLERQMNEIAEGGVDATKQMEAFDRASGKAYADLERSAVRLNYSISEQGKAQRVHPRKQTFFIHSCPVQLPSQHQSRQTQAQHYAGSYVFFHIQSLHWAILLIL
jgi:hypothetical protein